ncbi:MAG: type IV toxin-antitoxin system AbiEi family antitoxin domain-containing protein [Aeromonas veronii]
MKQKPRATSAEILLEVIRDMHSQEQTITRETLQKYAGIAGLTKTQIDDRLAYLEGKGDIVRIQRGVYVPAEQHKPARLITRSLLPDGTSVLEIGDLVMMLTPRESRMLGEIMAGSGMLYAQIEQGHKATQTTQVLFQHIRELRQLIIGKSSDMGCPEFIQIGGEH